MLQRTHTRLRGVDDDEKGFTLVGVVVVVLVIGILAVIALPTFLARQRKAQDDLAKSDVRNAVTQIEACLTDATGRAAATACASTANEGLAKLKLVFAPGAPARSSSLVSGSPVYSVGAVSKSRDTFTISRAADGNLLYSSAGARTDAEWDANSTVTR